MKSSVNCKAGFGFRVPAFGAAVASSRGELLILILILILIPAGEAFRVSGLRLFLGSALAILALLVISGLQIKIKIKTRKGTGLACLRTTHPALP